jgi:hypothetical protein
MNVGGMISRLPLDTLRRRKWILPTFAIISALSVWWLYWCHSPYESIPTGRPDVDSLLAANDRVNNHLLRKRWWGIHDEFVMSSEMGLVERSYANVIFQEVREPYFLCVVSEVRPLAYCLDSNKAITMNSKTVLGAGLMPLQLLYPEYPQVRESYHRWILHNGRWYLDHFDGYPWGDGPGRSHSSIQDSGWLPIKAE